MNTNLLPEPEANPRVVALMEKYREDHKFYEKHSIVKIESPYLAVRVDGRAFHTLTKSLTHPYDPNFEAAMEKGCEAVLRENSSIVMCYTASDEASFVFKPQTETHDLRLEKVTSLIAAVMSVHFSQRLGQTGYFDARVLTLDSIEDVLACLAERQQDTIKNSTSSLAYWTLRDSGHSARQADRILAPLSSRKRRELLDTLNVPFNSLPPHQRRGKLLTYKEVEKLGYNPITKTSVPCIRRVLEWDNDMPDFRFLQTIPGLEVTAGSTLELA